MTGVALTARAPYKSVFVHGFTLDEAGNKMSKSLGNVVDPRTVVEARGVDVLRWWVGLHASSSTSVLVGNKILAASQGELNKIRNTLKFFLGVLNSFSADRQSVSVDELLLLDRILLHKVRRLQDRTGESYARREYNKVCLAVLAFVADISATHFHLAKDRLYCEAKESAARRSGLTALHLASQVTETSNPDSLTIEI